MKGKEPQPRYIKLVKKNRQTGTMIEVDYGMNEANNYQATCYGHVEVTKGGGVNVIVSHGNYINVEDSQASILRLASDPLGWCRECQLEAMVAQGTFTKELFVEEFMPWGVTEEEIDRAWKMFNRGLALGKIVGNKHKEASV